MSQFNNCSLRGFDRGQDMRGILENYLGLSRRIIAVLSRQNWKHSIKYINVRYVPRKYTSFHSHRPQIWCSFCERYDTADDWLSCSYRALDEDRLPSTSTNQTSLSLLFLVYPGKRQNGP